MAFDPAAFRALVSSVEAEHEQALTAATSGKVVDVKSFEYSGGTEIVSVMAYGSKGRIDRFDWPSLRYARLIDADGAHLYGNISEIAADLAKWEKDNLRYGELAAGEWNLSSTSPRSVHAALSFTATAAGAQIIGEGALQLLSVAKDLLEKLI